jgi:transglutaminase-like putative cysteine protease
MRLRIAHSIVHHYEPPAAGAIEVLRLTPRNHEGQYVIGWRIDVSADARLNAHEDAFGNLTHVFSTDRPFDELILKVDGEVETQNSDGVVRGAVERFPPTLFLRDTALTEPDAAIREFARAAGAAADGAGLGALHSVLHRLHQTMAHESTPAAVTVGGAQAFADGRGAANDLAHVFIGAAHSLGIPARYVTGYLFAGGAVEQGSSHAWAEAFVSDLGWVGFDPSSGVCPTEAYVRVAVGLDAIGAAPVRGARHGVGAETSAVAIKVDQ